MKTQVKKSKMVNGVDIYRLKETMDAVKETPSIAQFKFRNENEWIDGGHNRSMIKSFYGVGQEDTSRTEPFYLDCDEPDVLLGQDNGANPVEHLLNALSGCITTALVYHAAARGYKIDKIRSTYEGEIDLQGFLGLDPNVRRGYQKINVTFDIEGDLTREQKQEMIDLGQQYSPVFDSLTNGVNVEVKLA